MTAISYEQVSTLYTSRHLSAFNCLCVRLFVCAAMASMQHIIARTHSRTHILAISLFVLPIVEERQVS